MKIFLLTTALLLTVFTMAFGQTVTPTPMATNQLTPDQVFMEALRKQRDNALSQASDAIARIQVLTAEELALERYWSKYVAGLNPKPLSSNTAPVKSPK